MLLCCADRFQQWAFGDGGMREIWANLPAQGQCLYPLLRSTSDLLMMPKDLLLEEGIRADMCSSVSGCTWYQGWGCWCRNLPVAVCMCMCMCELLERRVCADAVGQLNMFVGFWLAFDKVLACAP